MDQVKLDLLPRSSAAGCGDCLCRKCLFWWSGRCPYGVCYDDHRAKTDPYDKAHPGQPPRKGWTLWREQQAWWCRGGICYPQHSCRHYVEYAGQKVKTCLRANVSVFQDGYIHCPIVENVGCQWCWDQHMGARKARRNPNDEL